MVVSESSNFLINDFSFCDTEEGPVHISIFSESLATEAQAYTSTLSHPREALLTRQAVKLIVGRDPPIAGL
jgi:hypothetical protein